MSMSKVFSPVSFEIAQKFWNAHSSLLVIEPNDLDLNDFVRLARGRTFKLTSNWDLADEVEMLLRWIVSLPR